MSSPLCGAGKHLRIPENRTNGDRCKLCASEAKKATTDRLRQSLRAESDRDQTKRNLQLRGAKVTAKGLVGAKVTSDDDHAEHLRAGAILTLMDQLDLAVTVWQRQSIQNDINFLKDGNKWAR